MRGEDIKTLIRSAEEGILDARADPTKYPGYHGNMLAGMNKILDAYISPINVSAEYIDSISKGDNLRKLLRHTARYSMMGTISLRVSSQPFQRTNAEN
mgnify:CR=1 FL=1